MRSRKPLARNAEMLRRRANRSARRYLLTRTLRCSHCEMKLVSRPRADGTRCYVCASVWGAKITVLPANRSCLAARHRVSAPHTRFTSPRLTGDVDRRIAGVRSMRNAHEASRQAL